MEKLLLLLIPMMMNVITPQLREVMHKWLDDMEEKAKSTPNPWDDLFVGALKLVLNGR